MEEVALNKPGLKAPGLGGFPERVTLCEQHTWTSSRSQPNLALNLGPASVALGSCVFCQTWERGHFLKRGTTSGESTNFVYISDATECPLGGLGAEQGSSSKQTF